MKQFLKENFTLAIGISLPLLLMVLFLIAGQTAQIMVAAPQYDAVFATNYNKNWRNQSWRIEVKNQQITIRYNNKSAATYAPPHIYVIDHETLHAREVHINFNVLRAGKIVDPALNELNKNKFITTQESPDGYRLEQNSGSDDGVLVGNPMDSNSHSYALKKDNHAIAIKGTDHIYEAQLIAWIDK